MKKINKKEIIKVKCGHKTVLLCSLHVNFAQYPCDIIRKNLERQETNKNGRGDRAALT